MADLYVVIVHETVEGAHWARSFASLGGYYRSGFKEVSGRSDVYNAMVTTSLATGVDLHFNHLTQEQWLERRWDYDVEMGPYGEDPYAKNPTEADDFLNPKVEEEPPSLEDEEITPVPREFDF